LETLLLLNGMVTAKIYATPTNLPSVIGLEMIFLDIR
jgi:hypothetical protein